MSSAQAAGGNENVLNQGATSEGVILEAGGCIVTILPQFGGKIASIRLRDRELLQQPLAPIAPRTQTMGFEEGDASGWDECLPSVAACRVNFDGGTAEIPDHGDLWRVEWQSTGTSDEERGTNSLALRAQCFSLGLELERTVALTETENGWRIGLDYRLTNTGTAPAPWSWAAHPLFLAGAGDRITLPDSIRTLRLEGSGGGRLGKNGDAVSWPVAKLEDGGETNLSLALAPDSGIGDKLFAGPVAAAGNWAELVRPSAGVKIRVSFDAAATPYLGLWICYGGWPDRDGPKQTCVALEPATAPVDSLAEAGSWMRQLGPGEWFKWSMQVEIESL